MLRDGLRRRSIASASLHCDSSRPNDGAIGLCSDARCIRRIVDEFGSSAVQLRIKFASECLTST